MTAQEEYWQLIRDWVKAIKSLETVNDNLHSFFEQHRGETFKAFDPKVVQAMLREDVEA